MIAARVCSSWNSLVHCQTLPTRSRLQKGLLPEDGRRPAWRQKSAPLFGAGLRRALQSLPKDRGGRPYLRGVLHSHSLGDLAAQPA